MGCPGSVHLHATLPPSLQPLHLTVQFCWTESLFKPALVHLAMGSESDVFCTLRFQLRCNTLKFKMEHALCLPAPGNRQVLHVTDECEQDLKAIPPANRRSTKRSTCGIIGVFHKNWSTRSSGKAVRNIRPDALYHTIDYSSDIPPFSMTQFRTGLGTRDPVQAPADPTEAWDPKS